MKSAFDCKHVKSVHAWAVLHPSTKKSEHPHPHDSFAGKIVADFSDNPAGSVCTCTVVIWDGPLAKMRDEYETRTGDKYGKNPMSGRAGGYGYCKFSTAFYEACKTVDPSIKGVAGVGESAMKAYLASHGYTVLEVL